MGKKARKKNGAKPLESLQSLVEMGERCLGEFRFEEAVTVLKRARALAPTDTEIMDLLAEAHMELGDPHTALNLFQESARLAPDTKPDKWLYMGQMSTGRNALQCFQKAIDLLMVQLSHVASTQPGEGAKLALQMSTAYCSMGELFTTDLCDEPEAEMECERVLQHAIAAAETNPEAHAALANLRLIQGRQEEASASLRRTIALYEAQEAENKGELATSYESRTSCAKMCIELSMFSEAADLLEGLLEEDDRFVEIWYLAGLCHRQNQEYDTAQKCLARAEEMLQQSLANPTPDSPDPSESNALMQKIQEEARRIEPQHLEAEREQERLAAQEEERQGQAEESDEEMHIHS